MVDLDLITFIRFRDLTNDLAPLLCGFTFICGATALDSITIRQRSSPPADRPDCHRILLSQLKFFCFMADHKGFAFTKRVFHPVQTDFDFQPLAAVCNRKPKFSIFLRRRPWPTCECPS